MFVRDLTETIKLGEEFARSLTPHSIVLLKGPIGSGKTSFVKVVAKGLSIIEDITSPTFALSHHYISGITPLIHLDLYRLENRITAKEFFASEEEEAFLNNAILVVEWPELIENDVNNFWKIEINYENAYKCL